jgi:hypothetical protein
MRWLRIGIAVVVTGVLLTPGVAGSAAKTKRAVDITVKAAVVDSANGVNTVAGALSGKPFGSGAVVYKSRPSGSAIAATFKAFYAKGTLRGTSLLTPTSQPDGSISFNGTLQVKGGTGKYRDAEGKDLKVTGTLTNNRISFRITGGVRY